MFGNFAKAVPYYRVGTARIEPLSQLKASEEVEEMRGGLLNE